MSCVDSAILADYWLAALPAGEEEAIEEHVFSCDDCARRLHEITEMAEGVRMLARRANMRIVVSDKFLERAAQQGLRVREYVVPPNGRVECTVTEEDDILVGRLEADFSGVEQVDLCYCDPNGAEQMRISDVPVAPGPGSIALQQPIDWAKSSPSSTLVCRLIGRYAGGVERKLGDYTFNHTRTIG